MCYKDLYIHFCSNHSFWNNRSMNINQLNVMQLIAQLIRTHTHKLNWRTLFITLWTFRNGHVVKQRECANITLKFRYHFFLLRQWKFLLIAIIIRYYVRYISKNHSWFNFSVIAGCLSQNILVDARSSMPRFVKDK